MSTSIRTYSSSTSATNNTNGELDAAIALWSACHWNDVRDQMHETVTASKHHRDQSSAARKVLADATKQFKRSVKSAETAVAATTFTTAAAAATLQQQQEDVTVAVEALTKECRMIVKAYQEQVDQLTRRCKTSEQGYQMILSSLGDVPDPVDWLVAHRQHQQQSLLLLQPDSSLVQTTTTTTPTNNTTNEQDSVEHQPHQASNNNSTNALSHTEREELSSLRQEVAEYEIEFRSLKNQDITIRKLEDKIYTLQTTGAEQVQRAMDDARNELAVTEGRRARDALEREAIMEGTVQRLELQLRSERAGREASQNEWLSADDHVNNREAAWEAQRQILWHDNERVRDQCQTIKVERDMLALQLEAATAAVATATLQLTMSSNSGSIGGTAAASGAVHATSAPPSVGVGVVSGGTTGVVVSMHDLVLERNAYEAEVTELATLNTLLRDEARISVERFTEEKRDYQAKIDALEREMTHLNHTLASYLSQLSASPSQAMVDTMRRELRILKRLEYNASSEDDDDDVDTVENSGERDPEIVGTEDENDLETVLMAKLRRAEKELITERTSKIELVEANAALVSSVQELEDAKQASERLVTSLETDLERAIAAPAATTTTNNNNNTNPQARELSSHRLHLTTTDNPALLQHILDPSLPVPPPPSSHPLTPSPPPPALTATEKAADDHSVATIVMAQRDRLRARCEALEAERDSFKRELQGQVQASESFKADNTKLYEKVRYLQNYSNHTNQKSGGGGSSSGGNKVFHRSSGGGVDRDLDLEALEQRYEASVDPFKQFSKSERQRKLGEMSPMERTVFVVAKAVLSTKEMRTGLFFYVVALHLLVFVTTYNWSHAGGCESMYQDNEHLSHLPPGVQAQLTATTIATTQQQLKTKAASQLVTTTSVLGHSP